MAFRIPAKRAPERVNLADALKHILIASYKPSDKSDDLPALLHFASMIISQHASLGSEVARSKLALVPQFSLDPIDVAAAILEGIRSRALSVKDIPEPALEVWCRNPVVVDWSSGGVFLRTLFGVHDRQFRPTLSLAEVEALFTATEPEACETNVTVSDEGTVASCDRSATRSITPPLPELLKFLTRDLQLELPKEADARSKAEKRFGGSINEARWREAWRQYPGKRRRGEHDSTLRKTAK